MPKKKIVGLCPGLDGLLVDTGVPLVHMNGTVFCSVERITNPFLVIGDRELATPLPDHSLMINGQYLESVENDTIREYASDNPYGEFLNEATIDIGDHSLHIANYQLGASVDVREKKTGKSVFARSIFGEALDQFQECLLDVITNGDVEDFVFYMKKLSAVQGEEDGQEE